MNEGTLGVLLLSAVCFEGLHVSEQVERGRNTLSSRPSHPHP
jgi:hypothetical protein